MNEKITFPRLSTLLADKSGRSKRFSEDFLREFFALISERLEAGESVKVKGLGTFRLTRVEPRKSVDVTTGQPMEISGHSKVVFIPCKELAESVNAPFEAFTAIEISDDTDLEQIFTQEEIEYQETSDSLTDDDDAESNNDSYEDLGQETEEYKPSANTFTNNERRLIQENPVAEIQENKEELNHNTENQNTKQTAEENISAEKDTANSDNIDQSDISKKENVDTEKDSVADEGASESQVALNDSIVENQEVRDDKNKLEEDNPEEYDSDPASSRKKNWIKTLMISLGAAIIALVATFAIWYVFATNDFNRIFFKTASTKPKPESGYVVGNAKATEALLTSAKADTEDSATDSLAATEIEDVPTAPSDPVVYDTISTTRYLTTMAKTHYGNYNLWPYIYEENKSILGHPDRIRPGTPVVIPKLSKYGVDPKNNEHIEKAKKMGIEIYARYGKKI